MVNILYIFVVVIRDVLKIVLYKESRNKLRRFISYVLEIGVLFVLSNIYFFEKKYVLKLKSVCVV